MHHVVYVIFVNVLIVLFSVSKHLRLLLCLRLHLRHVGVDGGRGGLDAQQSPADWAVFLQHHQEVSENDGLARGNGRRMWLPLLGLELGNVLLVSGVLHGHALTLTVQLLYGRLPLVPTLLRRDLVSLSTSSTLLSVLRSDVFPFSLDADVAGLTVLRGSSDVLGDFHLESLLHELRMIVRWCG